MWRSDTHYLQRASMSCKLNAERCTPDLREAGSFRASVAACRRRRRRCCPGWNWAAGSAPPLVAVAGVAAAAAVRAAASLHGSSTQTVARSCFNPSPPDWWLSVDVSVDEGNGPALLATDRNCRQAPGSSGPAGCGPPVVGALPSDRTDHRWRRRLRPECTSGCTQQLPARGARSEREKHSERCSERTK